MSYGSSVGGCGGCTDDSKGIEKHKLNELVESASRKLILGVSKLQNYIGLLELEHPELKELQGKEYNDFVMEKVKESDVFKEYLRLMDEARLEYIEYYDIWAKADEDEILQYVKYNIKSRLKCEYDIDKGVAKDNDGKDEVQQSYYG